MLAIRKNKTDRHFKTVKTMINDKACLFHATPARNLPSILERGLVTPRHLHPEMKREEIPVNADSSDVYSIYLGNRDALNYPFEIEKEPVAMLKICFTPEESKMLLPDDDYVEDNVEINWSAVDRIRGVSRASKLRDYLRKPEYWEASVDAGYGAKYDGDIPADRIVDCEIGHFNSAFEKDIDCPGFVKMTR